MRLIIALVFLLMLKDSDAQTNMAPVFVPGNISGVSNNYFNPGRLKLNDSIPLKKWSFNTFSGLSTGFSFWKGGSASSVSVPFGLQLTRTLNNNLFAFGAVSVAPSYINFNQSFINSDFNKIPGNASSFMRNNNLGLYSRAELGLGYINDERTFQISASFGIEKNNYPFYMGQQMNTNRNPVFIPSRK